MIVRILTINGRKIVNLNRRKAIREKCLNCSAGSFDRIQNCQFKDCALHFFRSGKGKQDSKAREKAIRKFCLWCCCDQLMEVSKCPAEDCSFFVYRKSKIDRSVEIDST
jgi:hypothetical protein